MGQERLPVSLFSTGSLPSGEQFSAWRAGNAALFEVLSPDENEPSSFPAEACTWHLGRLLIGQTRFAAQRYRRDPGLPGSDLFLVRLHLEGGFTGMAGGRWVAAQAGDIDVLDLAQPLDLLGQASTVIVLGVPRPLMEAALPEAARLHGAVLPGSRALAVLLADHLRSVVARLPELTVAEADGVAAATLAMLRACLGPVAQQLITSGGKSSGGDVQLAALKQFIEANLRSRELSPEEIRAQFGMSRASLYRMFQPSGGVRNYVRDRRLVGAFLTLADPAHQRRPIGEVAFEWGFASDAHFGREFRRAFGCTPRQARNFNPPAHPHSTTDDRVGEPAYADWLRRLAARDR